MTCVQHASAGGEGRRTAQRVRRAGAAGDPGFAAADGGGGGVVGGARPPGTRSLVLACRLRIRDAAATEAPLLQQVTVWHDTLDSAVLCFLAAIILNNYLFILDNNHLIIHNYHYITFKILQKLLKNKNVKSYNVIKNKL